MNISKINAIRPIGLSETYDLEVDSRDHNFYANGIVVSNSHSVAYAILTAISIYCKFNHPKEFFLEALRMSQKKQNPFEQITLIEAELPYFGIKLLPPDLIKSKMDFELEGKDIRYGLSAIKGVAEKALEKLQYFLDKERANKFQVFHAGKETGLNIAILSALIQSGCLSSLGEDRPRMVLEAQTWYKLSERERNFCLNPVNAANYNYNLIEMLKDYTSWNDGKPFKESRLDTLRKQTAPYYEIYQKNSLYPDFAAYSYEKALLGYSYSVTLRQVFEKEHPDLVNVDKVKNQLDKDDPVSIVGTVIEIRKAQSKAGNNYMRISLADESGMLNAIMVGEKFNRFAASNDLPKEDEIIHIQGTKNDDGIWINRIQVQSYKIYFKVGELKRALKKDEDLQ